MADKILGMIRISTENRVGTKNTTPVNEVYLNMGRPPKGSTTIYRRWRPRPKEGAAHE